jgi:hypothetical protein
VSAVKRYQCFKPGLKGSTVVGTNQRVLCPLEVKGIGIKMLGGVADGEARTVHTASITFQRHYLIARRLGSFVDNVCSLHSTCVYVPRSHKLVT